MMKRMVGLVLSFLVGSISMGSYQAIGAESESRILVTDVASMDSPLQVEIHPAGSGRVELEISWPESFADALEIFASTNLVEGPWSVVHAPIVTQGSTRFRWEDEASVQLPNRFYVASNADLDTDADGLADGREQYLYGTHPDDPDSDDDGLDDGTEIGALWPTDPLNSDTVCPVICMTSPVMNRVITP